MPEVTEDVYSYSIHCHVSVFSNVYAFLSTSFALLCYITAKFTQYVLEAGWLTD